MQMKKIIFLSYILKNTWGIITGLFLNVHSVYDDWNFALQTQMYNAISLRLCGFFFSLVAQLLLSPSLPGIRVS